MSQLDYLVTGAKGQLGRAIMALAASRGRRAFGVDIDEMPLSSRPAIAATLVTHRPRCVIHCGAITNVDGCEGDPLQAYRINGLSTAWIAGSAAAIDSGMIYISTDFVFDGKQKEPYAVDALPRPLSCYGASKRLGEEAVLAHGRANFRVVRTSWVFGPGGKNFPKAILDRARSGQPLRVVTDQVGRPTLADDLAEAVLDLADTKGADTKGADTKGSGGIYHAANEGHCSWHQFAVDVLKAAGLGDIEVGTQVAADLKQPAARPAWSVLDTSAMTKLRGKAMPHYRDAIARYLAAEGGAAASGATDSKATDSTGTGSTPAKGEPIAGGALRGKEYRS